MRLSYYGGGHYDSVAAIESLGSPGGMPPSVGDEAGAGMSGDADAAAAAAAARGGLLGGAGVGSLTPEPGQLEQAALERSKLRAAEAGSGR